MPPSSLHLLITENKDDNNDDDDEDEDTSNEDEDATAAAADEVSADEDTDNADANDDLFPMAKTAPKKRGAASRGKKVAPKKSAGRKTTGRRPSTVTPPRGRSRAPLPHTTQSIRRAATPSTPTPIAQRTRLTLCSTRVACPPRMPSPRSSSYLEGRH